MAFDLRINFLGCPSQPDVAWSEENVQRLVDLGFNALQLNVAWGARPGDEPLNLEDVIDQSGLPASQRQSLPLRSSQDLQDVARRRADLRERIALCRKMGVRSIFHYGAPYNMHARFGDSPPNCLMDPQVQAMCVAHIRAFAEQFPGVDDLLVYTYDQDAWLCSEFGECAVCRGVPLHERVSAFVNLLARTWQAINPDARLWWEPWELSAGQVLRSVERLDPACVGLSLHSNVAEVIVTVPVDRWLRNTVRLAHQHGLPVVVEHFLGSPTEEVEPFQHIPWPLVTLRALRLIDDLGVEGIKEYYGAIPDREDVNLQATGLYLNGQDLDDDAALSRLAEPYGAAAREMVDYWRLLSEAMDLFPWYTSWFIREIGKCDPCHGMDAAFIRGTQCHTPSWVSTRRAIFMKTDSDQPDAWLLEDVQLQCEMAAERLAEALALGESLLERVPAGLQDAVQACQSDLRAWRRRTLSYVYHLRETNLTKILRDCMQAGETPPERVVSELVGVLRADMANQGRAEPCQSALGLLLSDPQAFVDSTFCEGGEDGWSKGPFTLTTR